MLIIGALFPEDAVDTFMMLRTFYGRHAVTTSLSAKSSP
jgi:hypothetical protein